MRYIAPSGRRVALTIVAMKEFLRLKRVPSFDLAQAPFPITQEFHRRYTLSPDYADPAHRLYISRTLGRLVDIDRKLQLLAFSALSQEGAIAAIQSFYRSRDREPFAPDFVDLHYLYAHIRAHRPGTVLEFGSGASTVAMAHALAKNGEGRLISVEPSEEWAASTAASLPPDLRPHVTIQFRPAVEANVLGHSTYLFDALPVDTADMIYIDGAAHERAYFQGAENMESLDLRAGSFIYIDHRPNAVDYFKRRREQAQSGAQEGRCRYDLHCYMVVLAGFHRFHPSPFGSDRFSNTLVQVTAQPT